MNLRLNQRQVSLVRVILPILLKVSRRTRSFLQQIIKVFRNLCAAFFWENVFKATAGNLRDQGNAVLVSEDLPDEAR